MRHYEFIREYSRDKTVQNWGQKMWQRISKDPDIPQKTRDVTDPDEQMRAVAYYLDRLERADPTKNKQYVQNLIKFYISGERLEDLQSTAVDYLTKFHKLKAKRQIPSPRNDLNRYTSFGDFASVIDEYPDPEKAEKSKGEASEVYKDANVRIITPKNEEAACYYGQGTRWCTAADNNNMFDQYNKDGPMYILLPTKQKYNGEKYQIHPESQQYMDETDSDVPVQDLMDRFGPDFQSWLFTVDPSLKLQIQFYPDDAKLESAWGKIAEIVQEKIFDTMSEWEANDDSYYSYLQDNGYVDEEGDIKDNAPPYDEYNEEAGSWQHRMLEVGQMPAYEIRELAKDHLDMGYEFPNEIDELDHVYDYAIKQAAGYTNNRYGSGSTHNLEEVLTTLRVDYKDGEIIVKRIDDKGNRVN